MRISDARPRGLSTRKAASVDTPRADGPRSPGSPRAATPIQRPRPALLGPPLRDPRGGRVSATPINVPGPRGGGVSATPISIPRPGGGVSATPISIPRPGGGVSATPINVPGPRGGGVSATPISLPRPGGGVSATPINVPGPRGGGVSATPINVRGPRGEAAAMTLDDGADPSGLLPRPTPAGFSRLLVSLRSWFRSVLG